MMIGIRMGKGNQFLVIEWEYTKIYDMCNIIYIYMYVHTYKQEYLDVPENRRTIIYVWQSIDRKKDDELVHGIE